MFCALSEQRPIPYSEILAYLDLHRFSDLELRLLYAEMIHKIDDCLAEAEKADADAAKESTDAEAERGNRRKEGSGGGG